MAGTWQDPNEFSASTTFEWKKVMVRRPPEANNAAERSESTKGRRSSRWRRFGWRNPRVPIGVTLKWRGGPEGWVEVTARGETNRYPGYVTIAEVVLDINQAH